MTINYQELPENSFIEENLSSTLIEKLDHCLNEEIMTPLKVKKTPKVKAFKKDKKVSFFDIDEKVFHDKDRWIKFINFSRQLKKDMKDQYDCGMRNFWLEYKNENSKPLVPWIDTEKLSYCQEKISEDKDRSHTSCFRELKLNKTILQIDDFSGFTKLEKEFPNFQEVVQLYKGFFILNSSRNISSYQAPRPLLLLGNPGIGKTRFAKRLAQVLGTDYKFLDSNSITSGAILTGHNASWRGADAGFIFKTLAPCSNLSPVILLDEVDKLSSHREYSPFSTFHQLLEPENSSHIYDEFLEIEFNGSFIIYILTANNVKDIPESLLSRMNVVDIQNPNDEQMKIISQNIFTELLAGSLLFKKDLPIEALETLKKSSPREVYQVLSKNLFSLSATQDKKQHNDFYLAPEKKRDYKIGF